MDLPVERRTESRRRAPNRIRFALERFLLRGLGHRLLLAVSIVAAVALFAGILVTLLDPGFSEAGDGVWWAFLRLTDPGYLGDDEGLARRSISTVVTVLGYVLFLGLLIAILTQWLNQLIARLESGVTPVALSDHVIVLGWSQRTPTIVKELLRTRKRAERFLARHGARELRIVILAERVDAALIADLRERLGSLWNDRQVLLRSGSPLHLEHLERAALQEAAVLILPGADHAEHNPQAVDAQTVKTLLAISKHASDAGAVPPLAVAEIFDGRKAAVGRRAYAGDCEVLAADEVISRLIAQSVRQRGLCGVFSELLTLNVGNAVYVRPLEAEAGTTFGHLRSAFPRAIPLGIVRSADGWPALESDPETILQDDDLVVLLARRFDDCAPQKTRPASFRISSAASLPPALEGRRRVMILGWSRKVPALLREFARYGVDAFEIDIVSSTPTSEREEAIGGQAAAAGSEHVRQIEASYTLPGVLERLDPHRYDNIVLLASERLADEEQADATTVLAYLMLRGLLPQEARRPRVFVELLEEENLFLFDRNREDVIVSPLVVSYLLSQVALRRELGSIFTELSRPWGAQIVLQPAEDYLTTTGPVRFGDLDRAAASRGEIALGFRLTEGGLVLNPERDADWVLAAGDEVVVLTSYAERDLAGFAPPKGASVTRSRDSSEQ
jgi:hypothetical protein